MCQAGQLLGLCLNWCRLLLCQGCVLEHGLLHFLHIVPAWILSERESCISAPVQVAFIHAVELEGWECTFASFLCSIGSLGVHSKVYTSRLAGCLVYLDWTTNSTGCSGLSIFQPLTY